MQGQVSVAGSGVGATATRGITEAERPYLQQPHTGLVQGAERRLWEREWKHQGQIKNKDGRMT